MQKNLENMHNRSHKLLIVKLILRLNFEKKLQMKSLVAWSISEGKGGLETDNKFCAAI